MVRFEKRNSGKKKLLIMRSFLWLNILADYLDFLAVVLAAVFAEVFFGAAILLAEVLLLLFFAEEVVFSNEDALFNREEDLLEDSC